MNRREPVAFAYFGYSIHVCNIIIWFVVCANNFPKCAQHSSKITHICLFRMYSARCLYSGYSFRRIQTQSCRFFIFRFRFLSLHFQVPYPMFSANLQRKTLSPFRAQCTLHDIYCTCAIGYGMQATIERTLNWQPLFILFTSKINLTPAQQNILDTYKMQIHLLFECGEDCSTSPVGTRFHVLVSLLVRFPSGWLVV